MRYRRAMAGGGTYFFTVNLAERSAGILVQHIDDLRDVMGKVKASHQFSVVAMAVLPEHRHALWRLPAGDADYPRVGRCSRRDSRGGWSKGSAYAPAVC